MTPRLRKEETTEKQNFATESLSMYPRTLVVLATIGIACTQGSWVPNDCMNCICQVESNCNAGIGCRWDVNSDSCGPFQIKEVYYIDGKGFDTGPDWKTCTTGSDAKGCSMRVVQNYMRRYATYSRLGHTPTCEDFSRIHNGGPNGYKSPYTINYWKKVEKCMRK